MAAALHVTPGLLSSKNLAFVLRRTITTSVWWDIDDCRVPKGCDPYSIAGTIRGAIAKLNYLGPVKFTAYGDERRLRPGVKKALSETGIEFYEVPYYPGEFEASYELLYDLSFWAAENRPPANCLIMSGDKDLAPRLEYLRYDKYNVLLAKPRKVSDLLEAAATTVWQWKSLRAGGPPEWTISG